MKYKKVLLASLLAASGFAGQSAYAAANWIGTADYTAGVGAGGDEEVVGPFSTYDFGSGVVLLKPTGTVGSTTSFNGYYQTFVTKHELAGVPVTGSNLLDNTYELTVVASFTQDVTVVSATTSDISVNSGGMFKLYRDTTPDRNFATDSGFSDGGLIMTGTILGGVGSAFSTGGMIFGATDISIAITGYDTSVYEPDTIATGGGIFTLRLGSPLDAPFLSGVTSVQGNSVVSGDFKFAADGYLALAVPEAQTYAMMLAGLGLVGFMARRARATV
ncbi:MAG: flocculation-associated PEP-CTERM protein PepA [Sulfuriferula multivorans]|uniref:Flocculation-associated PEP-CTERM protein PepA n=1 Tax=Sulfuriferula multivorans TaxID=1559896 RepID=A0A7C9P3Q3_9PROT|nr:flocculation-associated PEP-CTERM protein PepA [Sulfuriferula multivorans]